MSDAFWDYFFKMLTPVLVAVVAGWFGRRLNVQDKKLETIETLSNSMLSHTTEKKEEAEKKLEQGAKERVAMLETQLAEANRTIALMTHPPQKDV